MRDPVDAVVTQEYGLTAFARSTNTYPTPGHLGRDYGSRDGAIVVAPTNGQIVSVGTGDPWSWGYFITMDDELEREHILAHLQADSALVGPGDMVTEGRVIAKSDSTPNWPPHLHWQVIDGGPVAMNGAIDIRTLLMPERFTRQAFEDFASQMAALYALDPVIFLRQINQESGWNMYAHSGADAIGIAQIVPRWHPTVNPWDPYEALTYAARLMRGHLDAFGRIDYALAAYNAGSNAVRNAGGVPPYAETQNYVRAILGGLPEENAMADDILDDPDFWLKSKWEELAATTVQIVNRAHNGTMPTDKEAKDANDRYKALQENWGELMEAERQRARGE